MTWLTQKFLNGGKCLMILCHYSSDIVRYFGLKILLPLEWIKIVVMAIPGDTSVSVIRYDDEATTQPPIGLRGVGVTCSLQIISHRSFNH